MKSIQPELLTDRLCLRPFRLSDADRVRELAGDRGVSRTTLNIPYPYEEGMAEFWISTHANHYYSGKGVVFAQSFKDNPEKIIGAIGLVINKAHRRAELGYWVGVPYWGKGVCTEATKAILQYGFEQLHLHKILARHLVQNPASGKVMEKAGMIQEGTLVDDSFKDGVYHTLHLYAAINPGHPERHRPNLLKLASKPDIDIRAR